jgi:hypothetical protein
MIKSVLENQRNKNWAKDELFFKKHMKKTPMSLVTRKMQGLVE